MITLQRWSSTPSIWSAIQPFYFNGEKAVFLAKDIVSAMNQLEISYTELDGISLTAYSGEVTLTDAKLLVKSNPEQNIMGDVNADGVFNIADVILFQKWLLAVPNTHLADWKMADFCKDDRLNVFDFCLMKKALLS